MDGSGGWWLTADSAYSASSIGAGFNPQNVSAYFKRMPQSNKVTKSSSRCSSPRNQSKRRMTTQIPARTKSVIEPRNPSVIVSQYSATKHPMERPVSWHPNFIATSNQYPSFAYDTYQQGSLMCSNTSFAHGLVTPDTSAIGDEQQLDCPEFFLDRGNLQDMSIPSQYTYADNQTLIYNQDNDLSYMITSAIPLDNDTTTFNTNTWSTLSQHVSNTSNTAPPSPQFLPFPDMGQPFEVHESMNEKDTDELVGMGLYDSPAEVQSSAMLLSNALPVRRKSLKLEESFEPVPVSPETGSSPDLEEAYSEADIGTYPIDTAELPLQNHNVLDLHTDHSIHNTLPQYYPQFTAADISISGNNIGVQANLLGGNFQTWF